MKIKCNHLGISILLTYLVTFLLTSIVLIILLFFLNEYSRFEKNFFLNDFLIIQGILLYSLLSGFIIGVSTVCTINNSSFYIYLFVIVSIITTTSIFAGDCIWFWSWLSNIICPNKIGYLFHADAWVYPKFNDILLRWKIM